MSAMVEHVRGLAAEKNCILNGVPEPDYHALPFLSYSGLKEIKRAPGYYRWSKDNPGENTDDRRKFRAMHMLLAEPERASNEIMVIDGRRVGAVKDAVAAAEAAWKLVLKQDVYDQIRRVADFCRAHPRVRELLAEGRGEQTLLWKDPLTGVQCKGRTDWLTSSGVIADFKGFDDLSDYGIERQIRSMKYHWQAGFYTEGLSVITEVDHTHFENIFIRTEDPIDLRVVRLADSCIREARSLYRPYIELYSQCLAENFWPMSDPAVSLIEPKFYE